MTYEAIAFVRAAIMARRPQHGQPGPSEMLAVVRNADGAHRYPELLRGDPMQTEFIAPDKRRTKLHAVDTFAWAELALKKLDSNSGWSIAE